MELCAAKDATKGRGLPFLLEPEGTMQYTIRKYKKDRDDNKLVQDL